MLFRNRAGQELIAARDGFLSKQVGERFLGYALDQRRRMERHRRWIEGPPACQPDPTDFGGVDMGGRYRFPSSDRQRAHDAALKRFRHDQAWRRDRNPVRAGLEEGYGYDTKHAMHLVRLLKMGEEVHSQGIVRVRRPDTDWLLEIRDGALAFGAMGELVDALVMALQASMTRSCLPEQADRSAAGELLVRLHRGSLG